MALSAFAAVAAVICWSIFQLHSASYFFVVFIFLLLVVEGTRLLVSRTIADKATLNDASSSFVVALIDAFVLSSVLLPVAFFVANWMSEVTPLHYGRWATSTFGTVGPIVIFLTILVLWDFCYYWSHRIGHTVELFWGGHSVHHSSEKYNPSTAVRISFLDNPKSLTFLVLIPLLGINPLYAFAAYGFVLYYQLPLHITWLKRMPKPYEYIFNTPEHHRAHHARQKIYIDHNFGGLLIIWDRMFGTYVDIEDVDPVYGLTQPIGTYRPLVIIFHELAALGRKVKNAGSVALGFRYAFHRPYWEPAVSSTGTDTTGKSKG
jgi:sterol desaturase/sphingolipid hydroxylase (fatty acid hydroxylase superfamily)